MCGSWSASVIGNRSSCLSHASLIVPWPALSCQLQPASEPEEEKAKERAAVRGEGTETNHYTEREGERQGLQLVAQVPLLPSFRVRWQQKAG